MFLNSSFFSLFPIRSTSATRPQEIIVFKSGFIAVKVGFTLSYFKIHLVSSRVKPIARSVLVFGIDMLSFLHPPTTIFSHHPP